MYYRDYSVKKYAKGGMMANGGKMAKGYNIATNFNSAKNRIQDVENQADIDFNISMVEANSMAKCFEAYGKNCSGEVILSIGFDYFAYIELGNGITILSNIGITKFVYAFGHKEDMIRFDTYKRALEWLEYPIRYANKGGMMAKGGEMKTFYGSPNWVIVPYEQSLIDKLEHAKKYNPKKIKYYEDSLEVWRSAPQINNLK
jgi:hypothetical protein